MKEWDQWDSDNCLMDKFVRVPILLSQIESVHMITATCNWLSKHYEASKYAFMYHPIIHSVDESFNFCILL